jgi:hypothetical protein
MTSLHEVSALFDSRNMAIESTMVIIEALDLKLRAGNWDMKSQ